MSSPPTKETIRAGIAKQMLDFARAQKLDEFRVNSLPGKGWKFESRLLNLYDNEGIRLSVAGFEFDSGIFSKGCPLGERERLMSFPRSGSYYYDGPFHHIEYWQGEFSFDSNTPHAVWADYCGYPTENNLDSFSNFLIGGTGAFDMGCLLGYVTFNLSVRIIDCLPEEIRSKWTREGITYEERANLISDYIFKRTRARKVFFRIYQNPGSRAIMFTLGFMRGAKKETKKKVVPIIANDFEGQGPNMGAQVKPKFTDETLARNVYLNRVVKGLSAQDAARECGISVDKLAGVQVSKIYREIAKKGIDI